MDKSLLKAQDVPGSTPVYALLMRGNNPETPVSSADKWQSRCSSGSRQATRHPVLLRILYTWCPDGMVNHLRDEKFQRA